MTEYAYLSLFFDLFFLFVATVVVFLFSSIIFIRHAPHSGRVVPTRVSISIRIRFHSLVEARPSSFFVHPVVVSLQQGFTPHDRGYRVGSLSSIIVVGLYKVI